MGYSLSVPKEIIPKFEIGQLVATPNAIERIPKGEIVQALAKHIRGDWGTLDNEDWRANDDAIKHGGRILSAYKSSRGEKFWIITEADRSVTTVLLPEDY